MTERGLFLVLEGVEGAGKSTQARLLGSWMDEIGVPYTVAREPGGTPVGESIRGVLLDSHERGLPAETELLLMLAARSAFVRDVVRPRLAEGRVMLSDRFEMSSFAYQGAGRGLGVERVRVLNEFATGGLAPDLNIVLHLPAEEGRARHHSSGKASDRIEGAGAEFHERVSSAYARLAEAEPSTILVDAAPPADVVQERIRAHLRTRFPEPFTTRRG